MDDVLDKLLTTNITNNKDTSFDDLYKNWGKLGSQEQRRKDLLEFQKSQRQSNLDYSRGILDLVNAVEENSKISKNQKPRYRPSIYVAGFHKASPTYKNVLMLSEWMVEKPEDFETNWYIVPCPKAVRMLVVAYNGITKCYTKNGKFMFARPTALPGGNKSEKRWKSGCCVLDCFYKQSINTMFVVDILAWNNQTMTDGETEFRHYWMSTELNEIITNLTASNKQHQLEFKLLPKVSCDKESLNKFMMTFPHFENNIPVLDGLLFYHKKGHYFGGETPLVGWLYPYMVPEILGSDIIINHEYVFETPPDYTNQAEFIKKFEEKYLKNSKKMEVENQTQRGGGDLEQESKMEEAEIVEDDHTVETKMEADGSGDTVKPHGSAQTD